MCPMGMTNTIEPKLNSRNLRKNIDKYSIIKHLMSVPTNTKQRGVIKTNKVQSFIRIAHIKCRLKTKTQHHQNHTG